MSTIYAASCSYNDVSSATNQAVSGDKVIVPPGTATWNSTLEIKKGIVLQGAGIGNTIITGNVGMPYYMIIYKPLNPSLNEPFRLTGFTFDANKNSLSMLIHNATMNPINKIRIDHNKFLNCSSAGAPNNQAPFLIAGTIYGVVDNNTFDGVVHIDNVGNQKASWENLVYIPGSADNWYYEDNIFNGNFTFDSGGYGGRYCNRYNTYNLIDPRTSPYGLSGWYPMFDAHGNGGSGVYTTMGVELYGNLINNSGNWNISPFLDHRGGKAIVFFNKITGTGTVNTRVTDEYPDSLDPPIYNPTDGTPQRPNNGYYWNNRYKGNTIFNAYEGTDIENLISENVSFFNQNDSFNGTYGIGYGTLSSRPITCNTIGVGYWATTQQCSLLDNKHVGANPQEPISGILYKCTSTNTWTEYYRSYTYPHPLRWDCVNYPTLCDEMTCPPCIASFDLQVL